MILSFLALAQQQLVDQLVQLFVLHAALPQDYPVEWVCLEGVGLFDSIRTLELVHRAVVGVDLCDELLDLGILVELLGLAANVAWPLRAVSAKSSPPNQARLRDVGPAMDFRTARVMVSVQPLLVSRLRGRGGQW